VGFPTLGQAATKIIPNSSKCHQDVVNPSLRRRARVITLHDLIDIIAQGAELSQRRTSDVVALIFDAVTETLPTGEDVRLIPFVNLVVRSRKKHTGRNPKTGAKITIPARKAPAFRAGSGLLEVAGGEKKASSPRPKPAARASSKSAAANNIANVFTSYPALIFSLERVK